MYNNEHSEPIQNKRNSLFDFVTPMNKLQSVYDEMNASEFNPEYCCDALDTHSLDQEDKYTNH